MVTKEQKSKVEVTWLQCTLPRPDWDKLNARRQRLNVKWSELLPPAVERYLNELETGKIKVATIHKEKTPAKVEPQSQPNAKAKGTKKETKASSATKKAPAEREPTAKELKVIEKENI